MEPACTLGMSVEGRWDLVGVADEHEDLMEAGAANLGCSCYYLVKPAQGQGVSGWETQHEGDRATTGTRWILLRE